MSVIFAYGSNKPEKLELKHKVGTEQTTERTTQEDRSTNGTLTFTLNNPPDTSPGLKLGVFQYLALPK